MEGKIKELVNRALYTLGVLFLFRLGTQLSVPGIDLMALKSYFDSMNGTAFGLFNSFTGGALERFSVLALGVMPYITSSIVFSLLSLSLPYFAELQKEVDGRKKIQQWSRYFSIVLAIFQGYGLSVVMENAKSATGIPVVLFPGLEFKFLAVVSMVAGSCFVMWLGERITERGIGNGTSLIIFTGIAAGIPTGIWNSISLMRSGEMSLLSALLLLVIILISLYFVIFMERSFRRVVVNYAKRVVHNRVYAPANSFIPIKINVAGIMPPIFASALLTIPLTLSNFGVSSTGYLVSMPFLKSLVDDLYSGMLPGSYLHDLVFVALIIAFTFMYSGLQFKAKDISESLQKNGGFLPGVRPGVKTEEALLRIVDRICLPGGMYLALVCLIPSVLAYYFKVPFYFGGTSLLILIGVAMDTISQVEGYLISDRYKSLYKAKGKYSGPKRF